MHNEVAAPARVQLLRDSEVLRELRRLVVRLSLTSEVAAAGSTDDVTIGYQHPTSRPPTGGVDHRADRIESFVLKSPSYFQHAYDRIERRLERRDSDDALARALRDLDGLVDEARAAVKANTKSGYAGRVASGVRYAPDPWSEKWKWMIARSTKPATVLAQQYGVHRNTIRAWRRQRLLNDPTVRGDLRVTVNAAAPSGWLLCDGSSYLRSTYPALAAALGASSGSSFNVPDYRGRVIIGAGSGSGLTARTIGQTGGEENHALAEAENAAHNHGGYILLPMNTQGYGGGASSSIYFGAANESGGDHPDWAFVGDNTGTVGSPAIATDGSSAPHNNMQPFGVANALIKT